MRDIAPGFTGFVSLVSLLPAPSPVIAQGSCPVGWDHGWGMMGWFGPFMMFFLWIILIIFFVLVTRWFLSMRGTDRSVGSDRTALDIIKNRYAAGEITRDEFEQMKKDIEG